MVGRVEALAEQVVRDLMHLRCRADGGVVHGLFHQPIIQSYPEKQHCFCESHGSEEKIEEGA